MSTISKAQYCPKCNKSIHIRKCTVASRNSYIVACIDVKCWAFFLHKNIIKKIAIQLWRERNGITTRG